MKFLPPPRALPPFSIAVPSSIVAEAADLREKTRKIGYIGRSAAIFRVEEIIIYMDDNIYHLDLVYNILRYQELPPYLRKKLIPLARDFSEVGILPPLKSPHHLKYDISIVPIREASVIKRTKRGYLLDLGLEKPGYLKTNKHIPRRLTVEVVGENDQYFKVKQVDPKDKKIYWKFDIKKFTSMKKMVEYARTTHSLIIGATKKGINITQIDNILKESLHTSNKVLIIFGGPYEDIDEIAKRENLDITTVCKYLVNTVPHQGVESIRTEEAIIATLSILNYLREK